METDSRQIIKSIIVDENIKTLWWRWTSYEGLKTFFGRENKIELKPGGAFEIYFLLENPIGERGSETCTIISFSENKELTFTWNAPPHLREARNSSHRTIVNLQFIELEENKTSLHLSHSNWPKERLWDEVFAYFENAWDIVFEKLIITASNSHS